MASTDRFERLYEFLLEREGSGEPFDLEEAAEATGYARSSVRTHFSKKLKGYVVFELGDEKLVADGVVGEFTKSAFLEYMSQTSRHVRKSVDDRLVDLLQGRALDAFRLGVESWHRPASRHRVATTCRLLVEAWEQLLKAERVDSRGRGAIGGDALFGAATRFSRLLESAFEGGDAGGEAKSEAVRANLEMLKRLEEEADELLVPDLEPLVVELFQAAVLNWRDRWRAAVGDRLTDPPAGMVALGGADGKLRRGVLEKRYGAEIAEKVERFARQYRERKRQLDSTRFAVSADRVTVLTPRSRMGDVVIQGEGL